MTIHEFVGVDIIRTQPQQTRINGEKWKALESGPSRLLRLLANLHHTAWGQEIEPLAGYRDL